MDMAVSISWRLAAMKAFHEAGIRTTCFISPIFPGITDIPAIVEQAEDKCNLVWLENLNLRGSYKSVILEYIRKRYPHLVPLYRESTRKAAAATGKNWTQQYGSWRKNGVCRTCAMTIPCTGRSTNRRLL